MILTDQHNIRTLDCYRDILERQQASTWGDGVVVETPNIDRLAAEGALFTNFYTATPLCGPSRASFMSGLYPQKTGVIKNDSAMNDDVVTFAQVLKKLGYLTGYFGKWHLNGEDKPGWNYNSSRDFGFTNTTYQWNRGHWKYLDMVNGTMKEYTHDENKLFEGREDKHFTTDYLFDRSIEFMEKATASNESFAYVLSIPDPHSPFKVRAPYDTMYTDWHFDLPFSTKTLVRKNPAAPVWNSYIPDHWNVSLVDAEQHLKEYEESRYFQNALTQYFGMVKCIDDNVGKLLRHLTDAGIDKKTIIV